MRRAAAPRASRRAALVLAAAAALSACGYGISQRYVTAGGVDRIHVRPFQNRSTEPDLGALVTTALRGELSRRGADAEEGPAVLDGEVYAGEPVVTTSGGLTWRMVVEVRARLTVPGAAPVERSARRDTDFLGGADPLETEGRRALALRRAAADVARDILRALER